MDTAQIFAIVDQHFAFENPEQIERVVETFSDNIIWEAPARNLLLTNHAEIVAHYKKIAAGIIEPRIEVLRRFTVGDQVFDDRIMYFTAAHNNVWNIEPNKRVKLRLAHYFQIQDNKICHEIGYELWHTLP